MNNKLIITLTIGTVLVLAIGIGIGRYAFPSHSGHESEHASGDYGHDHNAQAESSAPTTWTCSMHPQIQQPEEGDCPICGMDLIPLEADAGGDEGPRVMSMSESSKALADIQTVKVSREFPEAEVRLVGKLDYDETREKSLTARFPARIDELFVNFTGIRVKAGEHLAKVYSPDLLTAQRELLTAYRSDPKNSITRAAREKLRLWDLLPEQIDAIINDGEARDHFVLKAPIGGVVVAKHVKEGDYVKTGEPLFRIVDLNQLWAFLNAYESDLAWLRYGQDVSFTVEAFPGEAFEGQIAFIEPEVNRKTRTIQVRVNVPNDKGRLKPGMFLRGIVASRLAENGKVYAPEFTGKWISPMHPEIVKNGPGQCDVCGMDLVPAEELGYVENAEEEAPLIIPSSAVLRTGKRAVVYVEKPDSERPTYEGREIALGARAGDYFLVAEGLEAGERVVTKGAFKIDSALQIQAKPSMMNPEESTEETPSTPSIEIATENAQQLMPLYFELQQALAGDDLEAAKSHLKSMMDVTGHSGALPDLIHTMLAAESLDAIRRPHFEVLSNALVSKVQETPQSFSSDIMLMHCPMVYDDRGADWLQASEPLQNPYFGAMMLKCGEVKQAVSDMMQNGASDPPLTFTTDIAKTILPHYLKLQQTLANDDLSASQANLKAMMKEVGHSGRLPDLLHSMLAGTDLNAIRRPHFEVLSNSLIQAIKTHANAFSEKLYLMHCPMVYDDRGADWIQNSEELTNPYWGDEMLYCGEVKGLLTGQDRK